MLRPDLHVPELRFGEVVHVVDVERQEAVPERFFPASDLTMKLDE